MSNKMSEKKDIKPRPCVIPVCAGERFDLVHKFPCRDDRTQDWLKAVDLPHLYKVPLDKLRTSYFVCSRHFRKSDYKNVVSRYLNITAVPCLNLKSLDRMEEVLDRCVRRLEDVSSTTQQLQTICKSPAWSPKRSNAEDAEEYCATKYRKPNFGFHQLIRDKVVQGVQHVPASVIGGRFEDCVERSKLGDRKQGILDDPDYCIDSSYEDDEYDVTDEEGAGSEVNEVTDSVAFSPEAEDRVNDSSNDTDVAVKEVTNRALQCDIVLQHTSNIEEAEMSENYLEIDHPRYVDKLKLDSVWLRDHCRCSTCYNDDTHQRKLGILDIPLDVKPVETEIREKLLLVKWHDGHESEYDLDFLYGVQEGHEAIEKWCEQIFWDQDSVHKSDYARVHFNECLTDDAVAKTVVKSLVEFGFAFIEKVPPNANMTEVAIRRLFPIQKTFFGEMWTFSDEKDHSDTAYSRDYLGSHTDNTYWEDAAGLQVLHCIKHTGSGGETFLVDGYKVANDFQTKDPKGYNRLTNVNVPSEYIESGTCYRFNAPIIRLDPTTQCPAQIRYNVYDRSVFNTIPQSQMYAFYRDFQNFSREISREVNQWCFKLNPGTVLIFDNWRILHGRKQYTGKRQITGCYVARCEFRSVARVMGLIS